MTVKNRMKIVLNVSCTYHKNKIRANMETHTFISFQYITCVRYRILGLLQYKDEVNIKYQAAVRASGGTIKLYGPGWLPRTTLQPVPGLLVPALVLL